MGPGDWQTCWPARLPLPLRHSAIANPCLPCPPVLKPRVRPPLTPAPCADCTKGGGMSREKNELDARAPAVVPLPSAAGPGARAPGMPEPHRPGSASPGVSLGPVEQGGQEGGACVLASGTGELHANARWLQTQAAGAAGAETVTGMR